MMTYVGQSMQRLWFSTSGTLPRKRSSRRSPRPIPKSNPRRTPRNPGSLRNRDRRRIRDRRRNRDSRRIRGSRRIRELPERRFRYFPYRRDGMWPD